jgi:spermidine synthase
VAQPAAVNTDFGPALYHYHLSYWLSQFPGRSNLLAGVLVVLLVVYLVRLRAVPRMVFAAGFAASGLEVVLLLGYQVLCGSIYRQVGLVVTMFMAGLAAGAWWVNRRLAVRDAAGLRDAARSRHAVILVSVAVTGLAVLLPVVLPHLVRLDVALGSALAGQALILAFTGALAVFVGAQFPLAAAADPAEPAATASRLYAADLSGAALGALLVSAVLVPVLGVTAVCLLTAGLNAAAAALAWKTTSRP